MSAADSVGLRHPIEELNRSSFQRILRTDDQQTIVLDELLEHLGAVSQVVR